jgi:Uroporphyrinogen decarboxylase (URO-D)
MDKTQETLHRWCSAEGIHFESAQAEEAYKRRARRIADSVQLKVPDRVPVELILGIFPALYAGFTAEEALFDREKNLQAYKKTVSDFQADTFRLRPAQGTMLEFMECKQVLLPGRGIPVSSNLQFVETECETADEFYDAFIEDPTGFMLRVHWPRIFGALKPLDQLRPLDAGFSYYLGMPGIIPGFGAPGVREAFHRLCEAGNMAREEAEFGRAKSRAIMEIGFPLDAGGVSHAPFDTVGDFIRGTKGMMLDMFRRPEKIIAATEKLVPMMIKMGLHARHAPSPFVFMPLHKGCDGFMSLEQYKTFYWPSLRKVAIGLIEEGLVPILFFEGENTSRLEVIKDIPKGKAVYHFEKVDLFKAKEALGDTVCFRGNVPISLLCTGTPEDVKAYVKGLINTLGSNGGLIVDSGAILDEAKPENVKAMVDVTKEYGAWR